MADDFHQDGDKIVGSVAGGCPCGNMEVPVPDDYTDETVIECPVCKRKAPHATFFDDGVEQ